MILFLLFFSQTLNNNSLAAFLDKLSNVTIEFDEEVAVSPANVNALVDTLNNVADKISSLNILVTEIYMEVCGLVCSNIPYKFLKPYMYTK